MNVLDKLELQPITVLDDYQATMLNEKEVLLTTKVTEKSLNPYGMAHEASSLL